MTTVNKVLGKKNHDDKIGIAAFQFIHIDASCLSFSSLPPLLASCFFLLLPLFFFSFFLFFFFSFFFPAAQARQHVSSASSTSTLSPGSAGPVRCVMAPKNGARHQQVLLGCGDRLRPLHLDADRTYPVHEQLFAAPLRGAEHVTLVLTQPEVESLLFFFDWQHMLSASSPDLALLRNCISLLGSIAPCMSEAHGQWATFRLAARYAELDALVAALRWFLLHRSDTMHPQRLGEDLAAQTLSRLHARLGSMAVASKTPHPWPVSDKESELARLATFTSWPHEHIQPAQLARMGFYATPQPGLPDCCTHFVDDTDVCNWSAFASADDVKPRLADNPFINGQPVPNVDLATALNDSPALAHPGPAPIHVVYDASSSWLATASDDGGVQLWDARLRLRPVAVTNFRQAFTPPASKIAAAPAPQAAAANAASQQKAADTAKEDEGNKILISHLVGMGFPKSQVKIALEKTGYKSVQQALDYLVDNPSDAPADDDDADDDDADDDVDAADQSADAPQKEAQGGGEAQQQQQQEQQQQQQQQQAPEEDKGEEEAEKPMADVAEAVGASAQAFAVAPAASSVAASTPAKGPGFGLALFLGAGSATPASKTPAEPEVLTPASTSTPSEMVTPENQIMPAGIFGPPGGGFHFNSASGKNKSVSLFFNASTSATTTSASTSTATSAATSSGFNLFGASDSANQATAATAFGAATTTGFGSSSFGSSGFGSSGFGQPAAAFGSTSAPVFGSTSAPAFGSTSAPAFGSTSAPPFGSSAASFGAAATATATATTTGFGSAQTTSFGAPLSFGFGSSAAFGAAAAAVGSATTTAPATPAAPKASAVMIAMVPKAPADFPVHDQSQSRLVGTILLPSASPSTPVLLAVVFATASKCLIRLQRYTYISAKLAKHVCTEVVSSQPFSSFTWNSSSSNTGSWNSCRFCGHVFSPSVQLLNSFGPKPTLDMELVHAMAEWHLTTKHASAFQLAEAFDPVVQQALVPRHVQVVTAADDLCLFF